MINKERRYRQKTIVDVASLVPLRVRDDLSSVLAIYSVTASEKPANTQYPKGYTECKWEPICMKDLKYIKQVAVSYAMHLPYVRELLKSWVSINKVIPHDRLQLVLAVLDRGL